MAWTVPPLPSKSSNDKVDYWLRILEVPMDEPGADMLRDMAAQRLVELRAMTESEASQYLSESCTRPEH